MSVLLKLLSYFSIVAGPLAIDQVPAMAPDFRSWALWLSGIFSASTLIWANARFSRQRTIARMFRDLAWSIAILVGSAVAYFVVNLVWTRETGGIQDTLFACAIVLLYAICFASLSFALVAGEKLTK